MDIPAIQVVKTTILLLMMVYSYLKPVSYICG